MKILHITCSPRGAASISYQLSQKIVQRLRQRDPQAQLMARDLWADQLPHPDDEYACVLAHQPGGTPRREGRSSLDWSALLIDELRQADAIVIGTPMHNYTVPSVLKSWLDHVVRIGITFNSTPEGKVGTLPDRPVYIAVSSGGWRTGEHARQPDFLEPYLRAILGTIGLKQLHFFSLQATSRGPETTTAAHAAVEQELKAVFDV